MYLVISLLVLRTGCGIWLYQFLIIAYLFTSKMTSFGALLFCLPSRLSARLATNGKTHWQPMVTIGIPLVPMVTNDCQYQNFGRHWYAIGTIGKTPNARFIKKFKLVWPSNTSNTLISQSLGSNVDSFFLSFFLSSTRAAELKFDVYELILICECVKKRGTLIATRTHTYFKLSKGNIIILK